MYQQGELLDEVSHNRFWKIANVCVTIKKIKKTTMRDTQQTGVVFEKKTVTHSECL